MKVELIGDFRGPVVATVGTWDPMSPECDRLLAKLRDTARECGIGSAAVVLDPPPKVFLAGEHAYPLFHDSAARIDLLRRSGVDLVVRVHFDEPDLYGTASDFFDAVCPHLRIEEFWLRHKQDLGRNVRGSSKAVSLICHRRRIRFRTLPEDPSSGGAAEARRLLGRGDVRGAAELAGCRPTMYRPERGELRLAWPAGAYRATDPGGRVFEVELRPDGTGMAALRWPEGAGDVLAFEDGPALPAPAPEVQAEGLRKQVLMEEIFNASGLFSASGSPR
jgi:hypothetical protein